MITWGAWFYISRTTSGIRTNGSYLEGYGIVHVYNNILYTVLFMYGTVHKYGGDDYLYLGDSLL